MSRRRACIALVLLLAAPLAADEPVPPGLEGMPAAAPSDGWSVWEGFEMGGTRWTTREEGGLIAGAISRDVASEGSHAYGGRVEVPSLDSGPKAGFWIQPDADFSGVDGLSVDLFNGTRADWSAKLVIQTGKDWGWNECELGTLKPGWNRGLKVDLTKGFGGKPLADFKAIPKINIVLTPKAPTQGALYLDDVRLHGPGAEALAAKPLAGAREMLVDGFEGAHSALKPVSGIGVRSEPDPEHYTQGHQGLKLIAVSNDPEADGAFGYDADLDLSHVQSAVLDVYNPGPAAKIAFAVSFGEKWDYAAGPSLDLKTGWNRDVTFNFHGRDFKSAASDWKSNAPLPSFKIRRFSFVWNPGDTGSLSLTIDNLRLRAQDDTVAKALAPAPPLKGWLSPLWDASTGAPAKAGSNQPHARAAAMSPAYSLPGLGPSLRLDWSAEERGQSADFEWTLPVDLRGARALRLDVYNPGRDSVDLSLAVQAGPAMDWMESQVVRLAPGWNHDVEIPIEGGVFKNAATQWALGASLPGRGPEVLRTAFWHVASPGPGNGSLYIAQARLLRSSAVPGTELPLAIDGNIHAGLHFEPYSWKLWDSGAGEGSFEKGLGAWTGVVSDAANGASAVFLDKRVVSQGSQALRAELRGNGQDKAEVAYDPTLGPPLPDLSGDKARLRFDLYNAGPPLSFSVAFTVGPNSNWVESPQKPLRSGWNRDVTLELDAPVWNVNQASTNSAVGATKFFGAFDPALRTSAQLKKMTLLFNKARYGTVYIDNVRIGSDGSTTAHDSDAEIGARAQLGPLELKGSFRAGHSSDGSAFFLPGASHAQLRGLGQELVFSVGEAVPGFDDLLGIYTGQRQFDNGLNGYAVAGLDQASALRWRGGFGGLQAQAFGELPWGAAPFTFGGQALAGLRLKAQGPAGSWVGATALQQRLGYADGTDTLNAPVDQSTQILEFDGQASLPFGLNLGAAWGRSEFGADTERFVIQDADGLPHLWQRSIDAARDAVKVQGAWSHGPVELSGQWSQVGLGFETGLSDKLYNATRDEGKILFKPGALGWKPADDSQGWWPGLAKGLQASLGTYSHASADKTYAGRTIEFRLENDRDQPLGYVISPAIKAEDSAADSVTALSPSTRSVWVKALLRGHPWQGAAWQAGGQFTQTDHPSLGYQGTESTVGMELSQRLFAKHLLSVSLAQFQLETLPGQTGGAYQAVYAALASQWLEGLRSELRYGRPPFGDELTRAWPVTEPTVHVLLEASF